MIFNIKCYHTAACVVSLAPGQGVRVLLWRITVQVACMGTHVLQLKKYMIGRVFLDRSIACGHAASMVMHMLGFVESRHIAGPGPYFEL